MSRCVSATARPAASRRSGSDSCRSTAAGAGAAGNPALALRPQFITAYAVTDAPDLAATLADYARIAKAMGAEVQLELVLPEGKSPRSELAAAAEACAKGGLKPARVIVCPAPYLKSIQPVGPWPEVI